MKVKITKQGNVKLLMTPAEAADIKTILVRSHIIGKDDEEERKAAALCEPSSVKACHALSAVGVHSK